MCSVLGQNRSLRGQPGSGGFWCIEGFIDLNTYKIQAKYIKKTYEMKLNETDYLNKIKELCKLLNVYESIFDQEDVLNVRRDISILEGKIEEDKKIKNYSVLIEHLEILCQNGGSKDTKIFRCETKERCRLE